MTERDGVAERFLLLHSVVRHAEDGLLDLTQVEAETLRWALVQLRLVQLSGVVELGLQPGSA